MLPFLLLTIIFKVFGFRVEGLVEQLQSHGA